MKRLAFWALPLLLVGTVVTPSLAQAQAQAPAQAAPAQPKWESTKQYEDYMLVFNEKDFVKKAANAEKFLTDHKTADPIALTQVFQMMILSYANSANWAKTLETVERMGIAPKLTEADKRQYTQIALLAASNLKNNPKILEYAKKVLAFDPNNFNALLTLSNLLAQTLPTSEPGKTEALKETLEVTNRALAQPRPQGLTDAQWNPIQSQLRQTTCMVLLNQQKYPESMAECREALKVNPKDSYALYLIGMSMKVELSERIKKYNDAVKSFNDVRTTADQITLDELKAAIQGTDKLATDKKDETLDYFARSAAIGGPGSDQAKGEIQKLTGDSAETNRLIDAKKGQNGNN